MTDEANSSVVLLELIVVLFRECNNQRLSPWGRSFFYSLVPVTNQLYIIMNFSTRLNKFCGILSTPADFPFFIDAAAI